jgi:ABC-2 type transport system ATP-binding protein
VSSWSTSRGCTGSAGPTPRPRRALAGDLGLDGRADDALEKLSHGNQQRVQLAAALVHGPELLVLDEPFSGLDPLGVESLEQVLRREAARGVAIVFSSHQLDVVQSLCDDVVVVDRGRRVLGGTLDGLRQGSPLRQVEVGFVSGTTWDAAAGVPGARNVLLAPGRTRALVPAGTRAEDVLAAARSSGEVTDFSFEAPPLSQLFLQAVGS